MNNFNTQKNDFLNNDAIVLFQGNEKPLVPPEILKTRMKSVTREVFLGMKELEIPSSISSKVVVTFNFKTIIPNPNVRKKYSEIILEIPLLFLLDSEDFTTSSPVGQWLSKRFKKIVFSEQEKMSLKCFSTLIQDPIKAKKAKKFILYHELAHILHGDIFYSDVDNKNSRKREKRADLTSAKFCGEAEGGIYLFSTMSKYEVEKPKTHPSSLQRVSYLQSIKYEDQSDDQFNTFD